MIGWLALGAAAICFVGLVIYSAGVGSGDPRRKSDSGGDGGFIYSDAGTSDSRDSGDGGSDDGGSDGGGVTGGDGGGD
jgi:hypothetical protein